MFCIRMNILSHRNNIVLFLACNIPPCKTSIGKETKYTEVKVRTKQKRIKYGLYKIFFILVDACSKSDLGEVLSL